MATGLSDIPRGSVEAARAFLRANPRLANYRMHLLLLLMDTSEQRDAVRDYAHDIEVDVAGELGR